MEGKERGAKREPARVVDDVRRRDLEELDVVRRRRLALPVVAPALDQARRPQAAGEGVARLYLHELAGRRLRAARVVVLAPARYIAVMAYDVTALRVVEQSR